MVATRSSDNKADVIVGKNGGKRSPAPTPANKTPAKKAKKEHDGKLEVGKDGEVGLADAAGNGEENDKGVGGETKAAGMGEDGVGDAKMTNERGEDETKGFTDAQGNADDKSIKELVQGEGDDDETEEEKNGGDEKKSSDGNRAANTKSGKKGQTAKADAAHQATPPADDSEEPSHGTLESGHIYFLYRPKIDAHEVDSIDDVSKFHILLIPKTGKHSSAHYHRIIEVGKKKMPDPGAKRQNIWGLVGSTDSDRSALKTAFGEYSYETKTKGTRHQPAARPAARGHYILHSPRDEAADEPDSTKQRDFKVFLAYEITTPPPEDFGRVQEELGLEQKGGVYITIKDPDSADNARANPRAANMPREKKVHYPKHLHDLFGNRRWIAPNPVSFLDYQGTELLLMSSQHDLEDMLGKDGERVEADMDKAAEREKTDIDGALKELGLSKNDVEIEALEGAWA